MKTANIARGLKSRDDARQSNDYVDADTVLGELQAMYSAAKDGKPDMLLAVLGFSRA